MPVAASSFVSRETPRDLAGDLDERDSDPRGGQVESDVSRRVDDEEGEMTFAEITAPFNALSDDTAGGSASLLTSKTSPTSLSSGPGPVASGTSDRNAEASSLHFLTLKNATTCESYTVSWIYDGNVPDSNITLSIVQNPLRRDHHDWSSRESYSSPQLDPIRLLSSNISSRSTNFTWEEVDVVQGWYMLEAQMPDQGGDFLPRMSPLYVANGTNTTCVGWSKPRTGGSSGLSTGDIAGIIIGAIAAAGLLAIAFAFPRLWRRDLPSLKKRRPYYLY